MEKEVVNNKGKEPIDYLRERSYRGELEAKLQKKFPAWVVKEVLDFLKADDYMIIKRIPVVPVRTY